MMRKKRREARQRQRLTPSLPMAIPADPKAPSTHQQALALSPEEQLALWTALDQAPQLTDAQRRLGAKMRGEP